MAVFVVTVYVPSLGGINGSVRNAKVMGLHIGHAACGSYWPKGTVFEIEGVLGEGLKNTVVCRDRGSLVGRWHIDLYGESWRQAKAVGKRRMIVTVYPSMSFYHRAQKLLPR